MDLREIDNSIKSIEGSAKITQEIYKEVALCDQEDFQYIKNKLVEENQQIIERIFKKVMSHKLKEINELEKEFSDKKKELNKKSQLLQQIRTNKEEKINKN